MAHPFQAHRQDKVEKSRVAHIARGYATGGAVKHADEAQDKKLIRSEVKRAVASDTGKKPAARLDRKARARGGPVVDTRLGAEDAKDMRSVAAGKTGGIIKRARGGKVGKGKTVVNVIVAPQGGKEAAPMPMPPPMAAMPPKPPMMPPGGPAMPPGAPMPPPGIPMRAKGGSVFAQSVREGTQVTHSRGKNDQDKITDRPPITRKRGGRAIHAINDGGAGGGLARLEKTALQKRSYP